MVGKRRDKKWPIGEVFRHGIEDGSIERMGALARESFDKLSDEQVAKLMFLIDGIMDDVEAGRVHSAGGEAAVLWRQELSPDRLRVRSECSIDNRPAGRDELMAMRRGETRGMDCEDY